MEAEKNLPEMTPGGTTPGDTTPPDVPVLEGRRVIDPAADDNAPVGPAAPEGGEPSALPDMQAPDALAPLLRDRRQPKANS